MLDEPEISGLQGALTGFHDPAFTYILKLPMFDPFRGWERDFQWGLASNNRNGLDDMVIWLTAPDQSDPEGQRAFLSAHSEEKFYGYRLATAAYNAAVKFFQSRQACSEPICSIYAQSELGLHQLHVHLVLGGPGLNKWNAKSARRSLQHKWLTELVSMLESHLVHGVPDERQDVCVMLARLKAALDRTQSDENYSLVDVLTYRTRAGQSHAARVNGQEYIVNYLLCKNARYCWEAQPERCTLAVDYFTGVSKTFMSTVVNGELIPLGLRKRLWQSLQAAQATLRAEPSFSGEMFGTLPEVRQAEWRDVEKAGGSVRVNKRESLMLDCLARCRRDNILTYEQLVHAHPDLAVMIEALPGGARLAEQVLTMLHIQVVKEYSPLDFMARLNSVARVQPGNKALMLLCLQGYNPWQVGHWLCTLLARKAGKQNTCLFYGPASTGKTNLVKAVVSAVRLYGCVNHQNKSFIFNDCAHKLVVWWEECLMHADWVEQAKCILGGTEFRIDRKHKESQLLPQTPVLVSTNNNIYEVTGGNTVSQVHAKPLRERVVQFNFMKRLCSTFGEITEEEIYAWLNSCRERFVPTLEAFLGRWGLERVPNAFPLQSLCSGCSQDWELHQNAGPCLHCGGVPELETRDRGEPESGEERVGLPR